MPPVEPADLHPPRRRWIYLAVLAVVVVLGLASRRYTGLLPGLVAAYAGDTLWALAAFLALAVLFPRTATPWLGISALGIAVAVEVSQLYQAPWINAIRRTTPGALILGHGFLWSDIACYTVGVGLGMAIDALITRRT